ncbi:MAG: dienelactone hydrolase family protein [Sciscionella sp.]
MSEIVLFHSVLGVRPGMLAAADRLRQAGHTVHVPDLYHGQVFGDYPEAAAFVESDAFGGYPELLRRTAAAVDGLPPDLVYAGFSNGGGAATYIAALRPGARAVLSMHAAMPLAVLSEVAGRALQWPKNVPVQVHYGRDDPFRSQDSVDAFASDVRASGSGYEYFDYPVAGHLFADPDLPSEYHEASAELMWSRALEFLRRAE